MYVNLLIKTASLSQLSAFVRKIMIMSLSVALLTSETMEPIPALSQPYNRGSAVFSYAFSILQGKQEIHRLKLSFLVLCYLGFQFGFHSKRHSLHKTRIKANLTLSNKKVSLKTFAE